MKKDLLKIISNYGIMHQLKHFNSEIFELNEAIIKAPFDIAIDGKEYKHVLEELADCYVMLEQFKHWYGVTDDELKEQMIFKIKRQLDRMEKAK